MALASVCSASFMSFLPSRIETLTDAPAPTSIPKAIRKIRIGKVIAKPDKAYSLTPFPMKIRSTMLYSELTAVPTTAGRA